MREQGSHVGPGVLIFFPRSLTASPHVFADHAVYGSLRDHLNCQLHVCRLPKVLSLTPKKYQVATTLK